MRLFRVLAAELRERHKREAEQAAAEAAAEREKSAAAAASDVKKLKEVRELGGEGCYIQ